MRAGRCMSAPCAVRIRVSARWFLCTTFLSGFRRIFDKNSTKTRPIRDSRWEMTPSALLPWILHRHSRLHKMHTFWKKKKNAHSHRTLCSAAASMCLWNGRAERWTDMLLFSFVTPPFSYSLPWKLCFMLNMLNIYEHIQKHSWDNHSQNNPSSSQSAALMRFTRYPCLPSFYFSPVQTFMGIHKETHH